MKKEAKKDNQFFVDFNGLGVVETPERLCDLVCQLLQITNKDKVIDPCCGPGAFLKSAANKTNQLVGIEIREDLFSHAKEHHPNAEITNRDFLSIPAGELREYNFTAAFMNPPYSQAKSKSTAHLSELRFIEHLLDCLGDNARAAVLVPLSTMFETKYNANETKKRILENHTLEGVITLNENTFYGVGTHTCLAVFTAHQPHKEEKLVKFINFKDDGWVVSPHIGLTETDAAPERKEKLINCWINNHDAENDFLIKSKVEPTDEWIHAFYYFDDSLPTEEDFNKVISDYLIFEFAQVLNGREQLFTGE